MKSPDTRPNYPTPISEQPSTERLDDDGLAIQAKRLIGEYKQALVGIPEFCQRAGKRILGMFEDGDVFILEGDDIPFGIGQASYRVTYRHMDSRANDAESLYITRKPVHGTQTERIELQEGVKGSGYYLSTIKTQRWGKVQWEMSDSGMGSEQHRNSPIAIEKVEALLGRLRGVTDSPAQTG